jgi:GTPase SAR1 family protein
MLNITKGIVTRPQKVVIYGPEGIGKSTLASRFPDPLFIDTEGGTSHLDVRRIDKPKDWDELLSIIKEVAHTPDVCKTLVVDTADWAEASAMDYVLKKYNQTSIEGFGYGKGYTILGETFAAMLTALDEVIAAGIHVVVTAHAKMRKFELPDEQGAFDRWEMKLSKQSAPLLKEWCDLLLFCNFETLVVKTETKTSKATGGKRVLYASHHPCWDAKNRCGLPDKMDLSYDAIKKIFENPAQTTPKPPVTSEGLEKVRELMDKAGVTESDVQKLVAEKGHYSADTPISQYSEKFLTGWIIRYWDQILKLITAAKAAESQEV